MDGVLSLKIYVHDVTKPSQLMKMETSVTEVTKVKNCHDQAVTDVNFSLKPDDQLNLMRRIFTSDKKCLSTLNNDVVEVDLKMDLVKSRDLFDPH